MTGWTVLMMAIGAGHVEVVRLLLDTGADGQARDENGMTALDWAEENGHTEVAALLRKPGAEANGKESL